MKKLLKKSIVYGFLLIIALEILVRIFHLGKDNPTRYLDQYGVEKWEPNQHGFSVTGNRKQNFSEYKINSSGFNSYREFTPTKDKIEIAIVGDSFIEGFHQDYFNSIGKKVENALPETEVYEYGYAGYDMADQLHLIHKYKEQFDVIDHVVIYIKFSDDLTRGSYNIVRDRLALESPLNKALKKSKLLVYSKSIGVFAPIKQLITKSINSIKGNNTKHITQNNSNTNINKNKKYIDNFKSLITTYGYDKDRFVLLLDSKIASPDFIVYLKENNFDFIDFSEAFQSSNQPNTLIYDQHWNNHGRDIIASLISEYINHK
ncbi:hypothetical protein [Aquimarina mytili]|uniref:SGNH/GDSL hydrolase family protein n=1 Tax=Aquimarina mytili TaxID=874423 RepID=A0A936ZVV2_9FLAO|nr:hypothetical protein [Aquimarina mytili]MBL0683166.1 hypothetical protein [Aquimarina mytili]